MSDTSVQHEANPQSQGFPRYGSTVELRIVDHPLITHKLTVLRDERTPSPAFRRLTEELVTLLAYEATRNVRVEPVEIRTPVTPTIGVRSVGRGRSWCRSFGPGLGMLDGMVKLDPHRRGRVRRDGAQ